MIITAIAALTIGFLIGMIFECNRWCRMTILKKDGTNKVREVAGSLYTVNKVTYKKPKTSQNKEK